MEEITRPKSLKEIAAERIRDEIVQGRLQMGEPLSENYLAQTLQVSKTPIREALSLLSMEGLVNIIPQKGTFVFIMNKEEIVQLCELRFALESLAMRYSHERNREDFIERMRGLTDEMGENQEESKIRRYLDLDDEFHNSFFEFCENKYMVDTYQMINARVASLRNYISGNLKATRQSFEDHQLILKTLMEGNVHEAAELLDRHIETWSRKVDLHPAYQRPTF